MGEAGTIRQAGDPASSRRPGGVDETGPFTRQTACRKRVSPDRGWKSAERPCPTLEAPLAEAISSVAA
jgi:hypothetical protein